MTKPLALTMGDPAGIAPEITDKAWGLAKERGLQPFFVIGDASLYDQAVEISAPEEAAAAFDKGLPVIHLPLAAKPVPGTLDPANAPMVVESIERAVAYCRAGTAAGMATNPLHKAVLRQAGCFPYPGHTEFVGHLCGAAMPVMILVNQYVRVVPLTGHIALSDVKKTLTKERIIAKAKIVDQDLKDKFGLEKPRLAIAGVNPHAGEGGEFGDEEIVTVRPAVEALQAMGINAVGPLPGDTLFTPEARETYDVALCAYHDQALIPLKTLDFHGGVNMTLGLPIIRTSPDHGTALDIAGKGIARPDSLIASLKLAGDLALKSTM